MDFAKDRSSCRPGLSGLPYLTWPRLDAVLQAQGGSAGVTTRRGGVSAPPYDSANLGTDTADHPPAVQENRRRLCTACGLPPSAFRCCRQVHGTRIIREEEPPGRAAPKGRGAPHAAAGDQPDADNTLPAAERALPAADGLITRQPENLLAVFTADCTPLILYDPRRRAAPALHAGWRGTAAGLLSRGVQALNRAYGSRPEDLFLGIGPGVSGPRYEVGPEVRRALEESLLQAGCAPGAPGTPGREISAEKWVYPEERGVDVPRVNHLQALALGIPPEQIETAGPLCTLDRAELFYSHRRDGSAAGRQAAFITLAPGP